MRGAALPAAMLLAALGLLLATAPRRTIFVALAIAVICTLALATLVDSGPGVEIAFIGCWVSVILIAVSVNFPHLPTLLLLLAAADAGGWAGVLIAVEGQRNDLIRALPALLLVFPAALAVSRGWRIAIRILSSWLVAIALLAALLPAAATPGYKPDHMD